MSTSTIVVGFDGSPHSIGALRWALAEAKLRHADVVVAHGWLPPSVSLDPAGMGIAACEQAGEEIIQQAAALAKAEAPDVTVRTQLSTCSGAQALLSASESADMVVVGSRGQGGFVSLLLGSVSSQVVHHSKCPVVVYREPEPA